MKRKTIVILLLYLSGVFVSYPLGKEACSIDGKYTQGERAFVMFMCLGSWLNATCIVMALAGTGHWFSTPAKW